MGGPFEQFDLVLFERRGWVGCLAGIHMERGILPVTAPEELRGHVLAFLLFLLIRLAQESMLRHA